MYINIRKKKKKKKLHSSIKVTGKLAYIVQAGVLWYHHNLPDNIDSGTVYLCADDHTLYKHLKVRRPKTTSS